MTCLIAAVLAATWAAVVVFFDRVACGACAPATDRTAAEPWWSVR